MTRRTRTLLVAWLGTGLLALLVLFLPVPYVVLTPTTPVNTLGDDPGTRGTPVLQVHGPSYPTSGSLSLTTVGVRDHLVLGVALARWVQGRYAVVPRTVIYPDDKSVQQVDKANVAEMADSRSTALVSALAELSYPETVIGDFPEGSKAKGPLQVGDRIVAVEGRPVSQLQQVRDAIAGRKPGDVVEVAVERAGKRISQGITLIESTDADGTKRTLLGIAPVSVDISLADVSGPSAGLMFALGIIDKLTPGPLTGGQAIAGTGTVDREGTVGAIGGVQQKLYGAQAHGAHWFLVPEDNCREAVDAHVAGLTLVRVPGKGGLHEALADVTAIGRGGQPAQRC